MKKNNVLAAMFLAYGSVALTLTLIAVAVALRVLNSGDYGILLFLSNPACAVGFTLIVIALWLTCAVFYWVGPIKE
jgi:hypothetical protein